MGLPSNAAISRLVSLVPRPGIHLTRFHGVFAPNSKYRSKVTPAGRGKSRKCYPANDAEQTPAEKQVSMTWAKRLKRVFNLDVETCVKCGGEVRIIATIEDPAFVQFTNPQDNIHEKNVSAKYIFEYEKHFDDEACAKITYRLNEFKDWFWTRTPS